MARFSGIIAPVTTPFSNTGELEIEAFGRNLQRYLETPLAGFLVGGTTGEGAHLSIPEKVSICEVAVEKASQVRYCLAGINASSLKEVREEIEALAHVPLNGVLVSTPQYYRNRMDTTALSSYFSAVAESSPFPVLLYNIPQLSGIELPVTLVRDLAADAGIVGIKESSGNLMYLQALLDLAGPGFEVVSGSAETFGFASLLGVDSGILAIACILPELAVTVRRHALSWDSGFVEAQRKLFAAASVIVRRLGVAGVKYGMDRIGLEGMACRSPLRELDSSERELVDRALEACR